MEIDQYAKSDLFIKLLDMETLWEVHMNSGVSEDNKYITLDGRKIDRERYVVHFLKYPKKEY